MNGGKITMKNLKRTLSLLLALTICAAFITLPTLGAEVLLDEIPKTDATAADYASAYGYDVDSTPDVVIPSKDSGANIIINLTLETIYWKDGYTPVAAETPKFITVDGTKWANMKFTVASYADRAKPNADFAKVLDKGGKIQLTSAIDKATKLPQTLVMKKDADDKDTDEVDKPAATTYDFDVTLTARPKLAGFKPNYAPEGIDVDHDENGVWLPTQDKDTTQTYLNLQIAYSSDGKVPAVPGWGVVPSDEVGGSIVPVGVDVLDYTGKPGKVTYVIRVAPTATSAASKAKKITPSTLGKAPNLKVDYKKNLIKLKAGMVLGEAGLAEDEKGAEILTQAEWFSAGFDVYDEAKDETNRVITVTDKGHAWTKPGFEFKLDTDVQDYGVRLVGTAKKPASKVQPIRVAAETPFFYTDAQGAFKFNKGKASADKKYEVLNADGTKFTKGATSGVIRLKNAAKYDAKKNTTAGAPVSRMIGFTYVEGEIGTETKPKTGLVGVTITVNGVLEGEAVATAAAADAGYVPAATIEAEELLEADDTTGAILLAQFDLDYDLENAIADGDLVAELKGIEAFIAAPAPAGKTANVRVTVTGSVVEVELIDDVPSGAAGINGTLSITLKPSAAAAGASGNLNGAKFFSQTVSRKVVITAPDPQAAVDAVVEELDELNNSDFATAEFDPTDSDADIRAALLKFLLDDEDDDGLEFDAGSTTLSITSFTYTRVNLDTLADGSIKFKVTATLGEQSAESKEFTITVKPTNAQVASEAAKVANAYLTGLAVSKQVDDPADPDTADDGTKQRAPAITAVQAAITADGRFTGSLAVTVTATGGTWDSTNKMEDITIRLINGTYHVTDNPYTEITGITVRFTG